MILDETLLSLPDGKYIPAIDAQPGRDLLCYQNSHMVTARIIEQEIKIVNDAATLHLHGSLRFTATGDQKVLVKRGKTCRFVRLDEIEHDAYVRGERAAMPISIRVVGKIVTTGRGFRVVSLKTSRGLPFVAGGVVCH